MAPYEFFNLTPSDHPDISLTTAAKMTSTLRGNFFPALGPYEFFNLTPNDHPDISLITAAKMTSSLQWLRADTLTGSLPHFEVGQISFPSFHAAAAALFIWALWRTPFVRWIGLILNMSMLIATPVHGSHYMVDVLAGVAITMESIPVSLWLLRLMDRRRQISVDEIGSEVDVSPLFSDRPALTRDRRLASAPNRCAQYSDRAGAN